MSSFVIRLQDLRFYSRIGVMEQERKVGNEFKMDVSLEYPAEEFEAESLDTTVSYADIYDIVAGCMRSKRLLLETVAKEISEKIKAKWEKAYNISVKITKMAPPIAGMQGMASVEYRE